MSWDNPPIDFSFRVLSDADDLVKRVSGDMLQSVIMRSPVDTGQYRGNHRVGINSINTLTNDDKSGALERGIGTIAAGAGRGKIVYISNSLPYAVPLENGHSSQAPQGVYALAFQEVVNKYK